MGIFKDFRLFFTYRKAIKKSKIDLESKYNIRIDSADRMYTVLNVPFTEMESPYNLKKSDVDSISQNFIREYISDLSNFLNSIGISELYDFYDPIKKVDKYSYLIVIGYKQLDSVEINKIVYRIFLPILSVLAMVLLGLFIHKI